MDGYTAKDAKRLRELTGMGLMDCKKAFDLSATDGFGGDVVLGAAYVHAAGFAIHVKGDRHAWNLSKAADVARGMRERSPELDEAFPIPAAAPGIGAP